MKGDGQSLPLLRFPVLLGHVGQIDLKKDISPFITIRC